LKGGSLTCVEKLGDAGLFSGRVASLREKIAGRHKEVFVEAAKRGDLKGIT